jgi:hypothetical protein
MATALGFGRLVLGAQAPGAQVEVPGLAVDIDRGGVDIGDPATIGMPLGMTDVMAEKRDLTAQIALQFPFSPRIL